MKGLFDDIRTKQYILQDIILLVPIIKYISSLVINLSPKDNIYDQKSFHYIDSLFYTKKFQACGRLYI